MRCWSSEAVALFTSVSVPLAVSNAKKALEADEQLAERTFLSLDEACHLLELFLAGTCFSFEGEFFRQTSGMAMGAAVSVTVADLVVEVTEQQALQTFMNGPEVLFQYVDAFSGILMKSVLEEFLAHLSLDATKSSLQISRQHKKQSWSPISYQEAIQSAPRTLCTSWRRKCHN